MFEAIRPKGSPSLSSVDIRSSSVTFFGGMSFVSPVAEFTDHSYDNFIIARFGVVPW